jgi:hypothetical protein
MGKISLIYYRYLTRAYFVGLVGQFSIGTYALEEIVKKLIYIQHSFNVVEQRNSDQN